jgi:hypothetical protein
MYSGDTSWPFSFENICALLGIEADYLRSGLAEWKKTQLAHDGTQEDPVARFPLRRMSGRRHALSTYTSSAQAA